MDAKEFGSFIAGLRKEMRITQAELASRLNVTDKAVSRWERGLGFPDINTLEPLADVFGISLTELMGCKKNETVEELPVETVEESISTSLEIAKYQQAELARRIRGNILMIITGVIAFAMGLYFAFFENFSYESGSADMVSSVVTIHMGLVLSVLVCLAGAALTLFAIWKILRLGRENHE